MKIKVGSLQYYMLIGLVAGIIGGLMVIFYGDESVKKINAAIFLFCLSLSFGTFIGLLKAAGTNFIKGLKAALYCWLFLGLSLALIGLIDKVATLFVWLGVYLILTVILIIVFGLIAFAVVGIQRTKFWQKFEKWLENNKEAR